MREGLAVDRSVQLVLIPLHAHLLFLCVFLVVTFFFFYPVRCPQVRNAGTRQQCNVRFSQNNLLFKFPSVGTCFLRSHLTFLCRTSPQKTPPSHFSEIPHPPLWKQGIHFHPSSSCFRSLRKEWEHCEPKTPSGTFR